jgi:hypothetical protein
MKKDRDIERVAELIEDADTSLLDVIDSTLNKGIMVTGEVVFGLANIDLIYLQLSALLCAADRVEARKRKR